MSFAEAIRTCFRKYVDFKGRARRSEYWYWVLFTVIVGIAAGILDSALGLDPQPTTGENFVTTTTGPIANITSLALFLPGLAVAVRRLHDRDKSGWWILLNLIFVIGSLILLFGYYIKDSVPGANRFGPNPKGIEGGMPGGYAAYDPGAYGQPGQQPYDPQNPYGQPGQPNPSAQPYPYGQPGQAPYDPQNPSGQQPYGPQNPYGQQPFDPQNPYGQQPPTDQPPSNRPPQQ